MRVRPAAGLALVAAALLTGCGGDDAPKSADVKIKTFQFQPATLTVASGTTVVFTNDDQIEHTVTSGVRKGEKDDTPDGRFDIDLKTAGASGKEELDKPGTYAYYCKIHPGQGMSGKVVVE